MISLDNSPVAAEGDNTPQDYKNLQDCYALMLRASAEYVVELDPQAARVFQRHVRAIAVRASAGLGADEMRCLQASFRGELREYRDAGRIYVQRLRDDLAGAAEAMKSFASTFVSNGEDVQDRVRGEMASLEKAAESGELDRIRRSVKTAVVEVERSYEKLNKANILAVSELQHEIRLLHREMEAERRVLWTDPVSGAWIKRKLDDRVEELLKTPEPFCVIVVLVHNLKRVEAHYGKSLAQGALRAMVQRIRNVVGDDGLVARLSDDQFGAVLDMDLAAAQVMAHEIRERLSTRYSVQENGVAQNLDLRVISGLVGHPRNADPAEFRRKMQQMIGFGHTPAAGALEGTA